MWVFTFTIAYGQTTGLMASAMAGEVAEVVGFVDMMARLFGGAAGLEAALRESGADLGKEREGQDQIALIPCRKMKLGANSHTLNGEGRHVFIGQQLLIYMAVYKYKERNKSFQTISRLSLNMAGQILIDRLA